MIFVDDFVFMVNSSGFDRVAGLLPGFWFLVHGWYFGGYGLRFWMWYLRANSSRSLTTSQSCNETEQCQRTLSQPATFRMRKENRMRAFANEGFGCGAQSMKSKPSLVGAACMPVP